MQELISPNKHTTLNTEDIKLNSLTVTPSKDENEPKLPSSMPTPPSDGVPSEPSPKASDQMEGMAVKTIAMETDSQVECTIERGSGVESGENLGNDEQKKTTPRAKTKGDIKKQLMKKKGQKNEAEKKEEEVKPKSDQVLNRAQKGCIFSAPQSSWPL